MTKKIKLVPSLQARWFELCKLRAETNKIYAETNKIYALADKLFAEGGELRDKANKLHDKANKLYAEGGKLRTKGSTSFLAAVAAANGPNTQVRWTGEGCTVGKGPDAKTYLFAEPL